MSNPLADQVLVYVIDFDIARPGIALVAMRATRVGRGEYKVGNLPTWSPAMVERRSSPVGAIEEMIRELASDVPAIDAEANAHGDDAIRLLDLAKTLDGDIAKTVARCAEKMTTAKAVASRELNEGLRKIDMLSRLKDAITGTTWAGGR